MNRPSSPRALLVSVLAAALIFVAGCGTSGDDAAPDTTDEPKTTTTRESTTTTESTTTSTTRDTTTSTSTAPADGVPDVSEWTSVTDDPSGVKFSLPEKPDSSTPSVTAPDGAPVKVRVYQAVINQNFVLQASVFDLAGRSFDIDKAIDGVATKTQGTVTSRESSKSGGLDVTDARISFRNNTALGYNRLFKVGDYVVQLQTIGLANNDSALKSAHQTLLSSFRQA